MKNLDLDLKIINFVGSLKNNYDAQADS